MDKSLLGLFGVIILFFVLISAFFSSSEIGMMSLNRYRLRHLVRQKHVPALRVQALLQHTDRLLSVILIGNTVANILASAVMTILCVRLFGDFGVAIGTILLTLIILIFGEIAPKTLAALHPLRTAFLVSMPLGWLAKLFSPLVWFANGTAKLFLRSFGVSLEHNKTESLSHEELRSVVYEAGSLISSEHKEMLLSILDLEQETVEDIMVPRGEIIGLDLTKPWDEILAQLENTQHTRLPLFEDTMDAVIGIVHLRAVLNLLAEEKLDKDSLIEVAEPCHFIPEATSLGKQLLNFRQSRVRTGLVVNEYGDIQGLVTLEDILEEIVGEFTTDAAAMSKDIYPQADNSLIVDASINIRELNRVMKWHLPENGPKTLSGLIIEYLEFIPTASVSLKIDEYCMDVIQSKDNRIRMVKVFVNKTHRPSMQPTSAQLTQH